MLKKICIGCLSLLVSSALSADQPLQSTLDQDSMLLIDFVDIRDARAEELLNIMEGKLQNLAIHFPKGVNIPLKPKINGDFFDLVGDDAKLMLEVKKDLYVRSYEGSLLFSSDLKEWKSLETFITGSISAELVKNESGPFFAAVEAKILQRQ